MAERYLRVVLFGVLALLSSYRCLLILAEQTNLKHVRSTTLRFLADFGIASAADMTGAASEAPKSDDDNINSLRMSAGGTAAAGPTVAESAAGPWPSCLGMTFEACAAHVTTYAQDCTIHVIYPSDFAFPDYSPGRVNLYVNTAGIVNAIPSRG
ncbi:hypothetical protein ACA910_001548 [Epithemia clementina (nom. ined.)]